MPSQRPDIVSFFLTVLLSAGIAALSFVVGFSTWIATGVGLATATVGWWAAASEP